MGFSVESAVELAQTIERIRNEKDETKLTNYQRELRKWSENVDKGYAWIALSAMWLCQLATFGPYRLYGLFFSKIVEEGYYTREEAAWPVAMILTMETLSGPLVSALSYYISIKQCILFGGLLLVLGNGLTAFSSTLLADTLLLGVVQGLGFGCLFIPLPEVINNYFLRNRGLALGIAMSGPTIAVMALEPLFRMLLDRYPWRLGYLATASVCCMALVATPLLKPNPRPRTQEDTSKDIGRQVLPDVDSSQFNMSLVRLVLATPAFHLTWYIELLYYWVFSLYALVLVDYAKDRGCSQEEAELLLQFQSLGEIVGRVVLAAVLDKSPMSTRYMVILNFVLMATMLVCVTQASSYTSLAAITTCLIATCAFIHILVSKLLVEHLGERQVTLAFGMASFICGVFMILRPQVVGFFRDQLGSYDLLMLSLAAASAVAIVLWLMEPVITRKLSGRKLTSQETRGEKSERI